MIVVFDTNVIISAFIASGQARDVFEYAVENHQVVASPYILKELKEKLTKKLGFSSDDFDGVRRIVESWVEIRDELRGQAGRFSDRKDEPILDLCITVKADLLITGDKKIRALGEVKYTRVIHPQEFWDIEKSRF